MTIRSLSTIVVMTGLAAVVGCVTGAIPGGDSDPAVAAVASKAGDVASTIGGAGGFGGMMMNGYLDHMPGQMGFMTLDDLASRGAMMTVRLRNDADRDGTFHLSYFAGHTGSVDQLIDVDVPAGDEVTVEIPCSEIVGLGPLDIPGEPGCHLEDGEAVDNMMAIPGFLGEDFICDELYGCVLTQDVDDLDGDGDTEELIMLSDAMEFHMMNGGPAGHMHGTGVGMMGPHMGM